MIKYILAITILTTQIAYAENKIKLEQFSTLYVTEDIDLYVSCADDKVLTFDNAEVDDLVIVNQSGVLELEYDDSNFLGFLDTDYANIKINTAQNKIKRIVVNKGAKVAIEACAINSDELDVDVSMGSEIDIKGSVKKLILNTSMGAVFNENTHSEFSANYVRINADMGGTAYLCNVKKIDGATRMGGEININENAENNLYESYGGEYNTHPYYIKCK